MRNIIRGAPGSGCGFLEAVWAKRYIGYETCDLEARNHTVQREAANALSIRSRGPRCGVERWLLIGSVRWRFGPGTPLM
jgi:hypothetical protein